MFQQIIRLRSQLLKSMSEKSVYDFTDQINRDFWCLFLEYAKNEAKLNSHWIASKEVLQNFQMSIKRIPFKAIFRKKSDYFLLSCLRSNSRILVYGWLKLYAVLKKV